MQYNLGAKNGGLTYSTLPLEWTINQNLQVSSATATLDVNVFDYITAASNFYSAPVENLNLPLQLLTLPQNTTTYSNLFHLRYTGLFETIPNKKAYFQLSNQYYTSLESSVLNSQKIELGAMIGLIFAMLIFCIPLLLCLDTFINQTVMMYGYMNITEIEKEVNNCTLFLEIFFKESYTVKLTFKKKN